jgi:murein L,D-transpeptidase YcbB/YkuD
MAIAAPLCAQDVAPASTAATANPATLAIPSDVDAFYAARPGELIWLRDAGTRGAAARLPDILRRAPLDGLADGPALGAAVEAAIERSRLGGQPADDKVISAAWVRFVQTLKRAVAGVSYGDPALALRPPGANAILSEALSAPSLAVHVDAVARVNPFYAELRQTALKTGAADDPRVRATLDRLRLVPAKGRAIVVDVANAELMVLEDGQVVDRMKVIVGKPDFATPLIAGKIHYVTFNPYWHIPQDVARRKVAPIVLKRGVGYLKAARYQTVAAFGGDKEVPIDPASIDWKAVAKDEIEVNIRQLTGPHNMMGKMKFGFVNDYGIFLHDTPHKNLFAKPVRNLSLGCIRLEHPERLAQWLLGRDPAPASTDAATDAAADADAEDNVRIDQGVAVYVLYLTARPDGDRLAFAPDVYHLDTRPTALAAADPAPARPNTVAH